jgi:hypothetical protein
MTSKLDAKDPEWVRRTDASLLVEATADKEKECLDNASQCEGLPRTWLEKSSCDAGPGITLQPLVLKP